jgi:hypothetical protein
MAALKSVNTHETKDVADETLPVIVGLKSADGKRLSGEV